MKAILLFLLVGLGGCAQMQAKWESLSPTTQSAIKWGAAGLVVGAAIAHDHEGDVYVTNLPPEPPLFCKHHRC